MFVLKYYFILLYFVLYFNIFPNIGPILKILTKNIKLEHRQTPLFSNFTLTQFLTISYYSPLSFFPSYLHHLLSSFLSSILPLFIHFFIPFSFSLSLSLSLSRSLSVTHTHIHTHTHTYKHTHTHTHIHKYTHTHTYTHMHTCIQTHTHTHSLSPPLSVSRMPLSCLREPTLSFTHSFSHFLYLSVSLAHTHTL